MKLTIRQETFETNSSSVHALVIGNSDAYRQYEGTVGVLLGEYGWIDEEVDSLSYLLTAAKDLGELDEWIERIEKVCGFTPEVLNAGDWTYVDHANDLRKTIERLRADDDLLYRFIMDEDSFVETGSDEGYEPYVTPLALRTGENVPEGAEVIEK